MARVCKSGQFRFGAVPYDARANDEGAAIRTRFQGWGGVLLARLVILKFEFTW
jgi:hypothetical protein